MRGLILRRLDKIKVEENQFKGDKWKGFMYGSWHISEVPAAGIPDGLLLTFFEEVIRVSAMNK